MESEGYEWSTSAWAGRDDPAPSQVGGNPPASSVELLDATIRRLQLAALQTRATHDRLSPTLVAALQAALAALDEPPPDDSGNEDTATDVKVGALIESLADVMHGIDRLAGADTMDETRFLNLDDAARSARRMSMALLRCLDEAGAPPCSAKSA